MTDFYNFIAIEGNIGAGKTTLCRQLSEQFNCRLVLEQFSDNPFLPLFYENPERYAFMVELFFMTERHKQLQTAFSNPDLFQQFTVSDYFFLKTLLFARKNLNEEEFRLFKRLFHILNANFPKPDILIYLHRSVDNLLKNIKHRGRAYEAQITPQYLQNIQDTYFEYFKTEIEVPILILNVDDADYVRESKHFDLIVDCIKTKFHTGMHQIIIQ